VILGLAASVSAVTTLGATCGKPTGGNGANSTGSSGFAYSLCTGADYVGSSVTCGGQDKAGSPVVFTYTTKDADKAGPVFFQVIPTGNSLGPTKSTTKFNIATSAPKQGTFALFDYSQTSDTKNSKTPLNAADPIVGWTDAKYMYNAPSGTKLTFTVTCMGNTITENFNYALWNSGVTLTWDATGASEGVYGAAATGGVPCCGVAQISWALEGVATEHLYIDAKVSQVSGKWQSATMDNVSGFDDQQPFGDSGYGSAKVRTCVTNQSCSTEADVYYVSATTAASSDTDAWVSLELTLRASAGAVGVSMVTLAAVALAHLF